MPYINGYEDIIREYFDYTDTMTRKCVLNINEADQNKVLYSLTSELYNNIVKKVDDIDYGGIPHTRGDITKLENYDKLVKCLDLVDSIVAEYKQDAKAVQTVKLALNNIQARTNMWERAFKVDVEFPIVVYTNAALAVIGATSFMIASCIEFIKDPADNSFEVIVDKTALVRSKENLLLENLERFNKICANGSLDKGMDYVIKANVKNLVGTVGAIGGTIALIAILVNIIPILRELVFFFFYARTNISDYFEVQADMLQMNAESLKSSETLNPEKRKEAVRKQLKIVDTFRKISNFVAIDNKSAAVTAKKEMDAEKKKYKSSEVLEEVPDSTVSSLF